MEKERLKKICDLFYNSTYIPISIIDNDEIECFSNSKMHNALMEALKKRKKPMLKNPELIISEEDLYAVIMISSEKLLYVVLGPFLKGSITNDTITKQLLKAEIDNTYRNEMKEFILSIPSISYNQILNVVSFVFYLVNGDEIEIQPNKEKTEYTDSKARSSLINKNYNDSKISKVSYTIETEIASHIKKGDVSGLKALFSELYSTGEIRNLYRRSNSLRLEKDNFISLISLLAKSSAIAGGLSIGESYRTVSSYIIECERCSSINSVHSLLYNACIDFANRVLYSSKEKVYSREVALAGELIKTGSTKYINVADIVREVGVSKTKLLKMFKEETGSTIGRELMLAKLEHGKLMLRHTSMSVIEISKTLHFSSQAYFQNVFKKEYGITPLAYRKENKD